MQGQDDKQECNTNPLCCVRLIGGAYATVNSPAIVGFCHSQAHRGIVTVTILKQHDCLAKECRFFEKYEDAAYWLRYERKEKLKQLFAEKKRRKKENDARHEANVQLQNERYITYAQKIAADLGFDSFKIIGIHKKDGGYTVVYISDLPENDWFRFREIAFALNKTFHKKFLLKHAKTTDGRYALTATSSTN